MTKSKVKVQVPVPELVRNADGVLLNYTAYAKAVAMQRTKLGRDVLKTKVCATNVCLICKEFSKHTSNCPTCKRLMLNFGKDVHKVPKGNKRKWKLFIEAYAWAIYSNCKHLLPAPEIEHRLNTSRSRGHPEATRLQLCDDLSSWVKKLDTLLDQYRK